MLAFVCCLTSCTLQYSACQLWYHVNLLRLLQARDLVEIIACTLPQMLEVRNAMWGCLQVVGYNNKCMLGKHFHGHAISTEHAYVHTLSAAMADT